MKENSITSSTKKKSTRKKKESQDNQKEIEKKLYKKESELDNAFDNITEELTKPLEEKTSTIDNGKSHIVYLNVPPEKYEPMEYTIKVRRIGKELFQASVDKLHGEPYFIIGGPYEAVNRMASMIGNKIHLDVEKEKNVK